MNAKQLKEKISKVPDEVRVEFTVGLGNELQLEITNIFISPCIFEIRFDDRSLEKLLDSSYESGREDGCMG